MSRALSILVFTSFLAAYGCSIAQPQQETVSAIRAASSGYPVDTEIQASEPLNPDDVEKELIEIHGKPMRRSTLKRWEDFKAKIEPDGVLVSYSRNCGVLCGDEGYAIVREGKVVAQYKTVEY